MLNVNYNTITPSAAVALQSELRQQISLAPLDKPVRTIAGADISFNKFSTTVYAGIVILSYPDIQVLHEATAVTEVTFPYVPGLLGFREIPAIAAVWDQLTDKPDVIIFDGHGIAHPRRMGIATHFGLIAHTPSIGCAKSLLCGSYAEPANEPFAISDLLHKGEKIGEVLRTKKNCKPVFISPGNLITMQETQDIMRHCVGKYRIPEPTRLAHMLVNKIRVAHAGGKN